MSEFQENFNDGKKGKFSKVNDFKIQGKRMTAKNNGNSKGKVSSAESVTAKKRKKKGIAQMGNGLLQETQKIANLAIVSDGGRERISRKDRSPRSQKYQALYCESSFPIELLESFSIDDSLNKKLNPFDYNEQIMILEDQLKVEFWRLVDTKLSERQASVLHLMADGKTQMEISSLLGLNQSSVSKHLYNSRFSGTDDESNDKIESKSKLRKLIDEDDRINEILQKIYTIRDESWF